ncbi:MAG: DUF2911 domain-containing protein [Candidatus Sulfotelmatobacter sp.]
MFRSHFVVFVSLLLGGICFAQKSSTPTSTASCYLDDGRQVYIRYNPVTVSRNDKLANGKPWEPGGAPMTLFTEAPLTFGGSNIPIGAYTVYPIPSKEKWTLAVNKNVTPGSAYDEKQDIARAAVETDQVNTASNDLEVAFSHVGDKCTLRIYFGKSASFAPFTAR